VGATGQVVATDLDVRALGELTGDNLEVRRHNIVNDELEEEAYDLVHARLFLEHLPERDGVLEKLMRALRPGGWIVLESVDYGASVPISELGADEHARSQAIRLEKFTLAGAQVTGETSGLLGSHLP